MGLLNSALNIGRTALLGYQGALQVIGNNISSAGTENYTRLTPQLSPLQGDTLTGNLKPGAGVALSGIQRNIDEALESRVRLAIGRSGTPWVTTDSGLGRFTLVLGGSRLPRSILRARCLNGPAMAPSLSSVSITPVIGSPLLVTV